MITEWWRKALGEDREPSEDQISAITAPHTGRRSVNAGAGTGKTSTLALRALYLIESEYVRADQIVVVTFTKKAAAEIGSRIADTLDRAIENGARIANDGRGVRCTTIHGLASDIRREFAFDLGLDAPPKAVSDAEAHAIFSKAFRTLLEDRLDVDAGALPLGEVNFAHLERDLGKLALELKNHGTSPETFESKAIAASERFGRQSWGQLYNVGKQKNRPKVGCEPKIAVTQEAIVLEAEQERANVRVVAALLREFDRLLRERGAATYGDLIGETTASLRARPNIVARLRARWRYVLLDESQDTSTLQLAFIETLFGEPGEPGAAGMMPVGDGRQAIYGFNGADEKVMDRLANVSDSKYPLFVNRRSFQEIVDIGHAVLESVGLVDSTQKLQAHNGPGTLACIRLQNFGVTGQPIKDRVEIEAKAIAREIARLLSDGETQMSDIAILVRRRTHAAVYLKELNRHGISAALDRRSGLFVADEIRDLLAWMALLVDLSDERAAVRILQSPLCGLNDAATIALATPRHWLERFFRDDMREERDGDPVAALDVDTQERLSRVRELLVTLLPLTSLPLPAAIQSLLETLPIAASYVSVGKSEGAETIGAQAIANLASFEVLAREFAADHPSARLRDFAEDIERQILYDDDVQEAELDLDGVRILTIHQAKGLEWPYVFVACSTKNQYGSLGIRDRVVNYDRETGAFAFKNDLDGRETFRWLCLSKEHDPSDGRLLGDDAPRAKAAANEQARVFYVALTRAKKRVYVTAPGSPTEPKRAATEAPFLKAIRDWARGEDETVDLCFEATEMPVPIGDRPWRSSQLLPVERAVVSFDEAASTYRPRISFTSISAFETCPRQARYRYRLHLPDLQEARPRFVGFDGNETPWATNAARLGSLVHRALEIWGRAQIDSGHAVPGSVVTRLTYDESFERARDEFADVTGVDLKRARERGERAVGALADYTVLAVEEPFELQVGDALVIGAVDLIARDPDGIITVVDYKTGMAAGDKYALQLALYRRVAQTRYAGERVAAAILRLGDGADGAAFERAVPIADEEVDRHVAGVGRLTDDEPRVGVWCRSCAYRGSPCRAPLMTKSNDTWVGVA